LSHMWIKSAHLQKMKYSSQCPVSRAMRNEHCTPKDCIAKTCGHSTASLKPSRSVHFPNDVVFQDHVRQGDLEQIGRFLRARKVCLDTIYHSGMAALHEAVLSGNLECVKLLVKYGADIHQQDEEGWTPLHMACSDSFPHIAKYLLSLGANPEALNECGEKPADLIDPDCKELIQLFE
ncbi:protein phosphatase 1 regulatory subunit 27-like, partial [Scleropages formosus]